MSGARKKVLFHYTAVLAYLHYSAAPDTGDYSLSHWLIYFILYFSNILDRVGWRFQITQHRRNNGWRVIEPGWKFYFVC